MPANKFIIAAGIAALFLTGCERRSDSGASSGDQGMGSGSARDSSAVEPSNTGRNERDRSGTTLTPGDQGNSKEDVEITRKIRRAITGSDQLSTDAKNIKIITENGKVTLRGPVQNAQEMQAIQSIVREAGVTAFDNQLEVKTANQ
jgi:osmotically-inducible protein OsmY